MSKMPIKTIKISIKIIRILSLIIWIPALISYILFSFGKLELGYMIAINLIAVVLEAVLFIIVTKMIAKHIGITTNGVIIPKGKFDNKCIVANSDILSKNIRSIHPWKDGIFRIVMELELEPDRENRPLKFYIIRRCHVDTCEQEIEIVQSSSTKIHIFDTSIDPKELINFKFSRDTMVKSFTVDELYVP